MKTTTQHNTMKTFGAAALAALLLTACGGGADTLEAKKAKLEQLKAEQSDLATAIKTLEDEISSAGDSSGAAMDAKAKVVAVTPVATQTYEHNIDVQGQVEGDENVTLVAKMAGSISSLYVKAGDKVSEGQVLAEVEHDMTKAQIADLKANLDLAREMYNKQSKLWEQQIGSEIQYLQAKANKESLEQKMAQLLEAEKMHKFISPINGTVDDVGLKIGQVVAPGLPAIRVVNFGNLKVRADISESYASTIRQGDSVLLYFPDINKRVNSVVSYSAKVIDPMTRTFTIEIKLPSEDVYRPNMVAQIKVVNYRNDKAITVPINTIQKIDGQNIVFVADQEDGQTVAKKREVTIGSMYNNKAEILDGLKEGEQLITTGFQDLTEGQVLKF